MRIESFGIFNPLCESTMLMMNRDTVPSPVGLSCKPCVTDSVPCDYNCPTMGNVIIHNCAQCGANSPNLFSVNVSAWNRYPGLGGRLSLYNATHNGFPSGSSSSSSGVTYNSCQWVSSLLVAYGDPTSNSSSSNGSSSGSSSSSTSCSVSCGVYGFYRWVLTIGATSVTLQLTWVSGDDPVGLKATYGVKFILLSQKACLCTMTLRMDKSVTFPPSFPGYVVNDNRINDGETVCVHPVTQNQYAGSNGGGGAGCPCENNSWNILLPDTVSHKIPCLGCQFAAATIICISVPACSLYRPWVFGTSLSGDLPEQIVPMGGESCGWRSSYCDDNAHPNAPNCNFKPPGLYSGRAVMEIVSQVPATSTSDPIPTYALRIDLVGTIKAYTSSTSSSSGSGFDVPVGFSYSVILGGPGGSCPYDTPLVATPMGPPYNYPTSSPFYVRGWPAQIVVVIKQSAISCGCMAFCG